jgi:kumamolisin
VAGGTSAAAPLWASLLIRVNQQLKTPVGYLNPLLYQTLSGQGVCRDITAGDNDTTGMVGGYAAKKGWDACTGWGSPNGKALLKKLQALKSPKVS